MIRIFIAVILIIILAITAHADTAQYYNETSGQMEVPIIVHGGADTDNYISFCSLENEDITVFNSCSPVNFDKVRKFISGTGYQTAYYYGGVWYDGVLVEPIEAGVGYMYIRKGTAGSTTWTYDTEFYCEECKTLEEQLMEFGEILILLMLLYLNHTSKKKNLLLVVASVTYTAYLTIYVNVNEHMTLIGFYILILAYFVLSLLPQKGGK